MCTFRKMHFLEIDLKSKIENMNIPYIVKYITNP